MPALEIVKFPNRILKKESKPVKGVNNGEKALLDDMLETMYLNHGVGLAAPQVGVPKRIVVVDIGDGPMEFINLSIVKKGRPEACEEGCLSLPGVTVSVKRARKVLYKAIDRDGKAVGGEAEGLLARALQHEIDHLDGRLIIDYLNPVKRFFFKRKLLKKYPKA